MPTTMTEKPDRTFDTACGPRCYSRGPELLCLVETASIENQNDGCGVLNKRNSVMKLRDLCSFHRLVTYDFLIYQFSI